MTRLRIIIVNWSAWNLLLYYLRSIEHANKTGFHFEHIVVVNNASIESSTEGLESLNMPLHIIRSNDDRGFAAGCNQGASGSDADYLLHRHPDEYLIADSLVAPLRFMEAPENDSSPFRAERSRLKDGRLPVLAVARGDGKAGRRPPEGFVPDAEPSHFTLGKWLSVYDALAGNPVDRG